MKLTLIASVIAGASAVLTTNLRLKANTWNYGDPTAGCMAGEEAVQINGLTGNVCSPKCLAGNACPKKLPPGTTAAPQCVLEVNGSTTPTLCVLICDPTSAGACGSDAANACQPIQGTGVCMWQS